MTEQEAGGAIPTNDEERAAWIERKIAEMPDRVRRNTGPADAARPYLICERCGGYSPENPVLPVRAKTCDCSRKANQARRAIDRVDLSGEMTFSSLEDPDPSVAEAAEKLRAVVSGERERGLFMFGLPGRGKTHLSVATARAALEAGRIVGVFNLAELVSRIQSTYGHDDSAETKARIIASVAEHDLIVLDDIGKEHRSADVESIVYQLVDGVYRARKTLVASSNLPGKDFVARYDGAVLSRFGGMCEKVVVRGEDRREARWEW